VGGIQHHQSARISIEAPGQIGSGLGNLMCWALYETVPEKVYPENSLYVGHGIWQNVSPADSGIISYTAPQA